MGDVFNAEYFHAVGSALGNGFFVLLGMLVAATLFTLVSGGPAARHWKKTEGH